MFCRGPSSIGVENQARSGGEIVDGRPGPASRRFLLGGAGAGQHEDAAAAELPGGGEVANAVADPPAAGEVEPAISGGAEVQPRAGLPALAGPGNVGELRAVVMAGQAGTVRIQERLESARGGEIVVLGEEAAR